MPPGRAAMRDQHSFRHACRVLVVGPLDLETAQFPLDALRDGDIRIQNFGCRARRDRV